MESLVFRFCLSLSPVFDAVKKIKRNNTLPPMVPYAIPFLGSMIAYGMNPISFLQANRKKVCKCVCVTADDF